jgi:ribokinase
MDLTVTVPRIPKPGETVSGNGFRTVPGGKGANQAVAAARLGGRPMFAARIGNDLFGENILKAFAKEEMDYSFVRQDPEIPTGVALISVDSHAENAISVAPGANKKVSMSDIDELMQFVSKDTYFLLQLEIPLEVAEYAIKCASSKGAKVILNPAPAAMIDDSYYKYLFLITPNEHECEFITGVHIENGEDALEAAGIFIKKGVENVIITCGSKGSVVCGSGISSIVPALDVEAVDTTGAGDTFNGALVVALSEGGSLMDSVLFATRASSISVTRHGAQTSIPMRNEM